MNVFFGPAIWAMNRMNCIGKFLFIGLLLIIPFAYVTQLMRKETDTQISFNRKERAGVEYISPAFRLLGLLQDCRTLSAAQLVGDASFSEALAQKKAEVDALVPLIDQIDAACLAELRNEAGETVCSRHWQEIKVGWNTLRTQKFRTRSESFDEHTALCSSVLDWILTDAANYSNLILDPDLDSYWMMDAFVDKLPRITEDMSQACARGIQYLTPERGDWSGKEAREEERLQLYGQYVDASNNLDDLARVNLKTAYHFSESQGRNLRASIGDSAERATKASHEYLKLLKGKVVKPEFPLANSGEIFASCHDALGCVRRLSASIGPELDRLILARVENYERDRSRGMIAAEGATLLHLYLFVALYMSIHASVAGIARFTKRMIEGTSERFQLASRDELGMVAESFNQINAILNQTRALKGQVERRGEELQASEERFRTLASRAPVGIFQTDPDGNCLYVNERWSKLASLTLADVQEKGWILGVHPDDRARVAREWRSAAEQGKDFISEYRFGTGTDTVWVAGNAVALQDRAGALLGFLGSVTDISEQKRVEKLKNEFISTVSHELRTPLTSIRGSLGLVAGGVAGALPAKAKAMVDIAKKNCERLVRLVSDILDIEKIESGKMVFDVKTVEIGPVLDQAVEGSRGFAQSLGVNLELENHHYSGIRVQVDPDRLTQVMANLLSNACKFSPQGGTVRVRAGMQGDFLRVSVDDQGPGIPDEFRTRIFQKFAQADGSDGRAKQGTGLGLNICKAIVERMGGRMGFESAVGLGSTFFFDLPALNSRVSRSSPHRTGRPCVLVCEDEADIATILRDLLEAEGHDVDVATTAAEAKELLKKNSYIGMTLDLALPDQDGISLVREMREDPATRHLPVVILSASMEEGRQAINGDAFGILDWLEKPIDEVRLKRALGRAADLFDGRKPRILHVEDDQDIAQVVQAALSDRAEVISSGSLWDARRRILQEKFDLLLLDIGLPDGSGLELLPVLRGTPHAATPVVIFSAQEISPKTARHVRASLLKSKTSNEELLKTINAVLGNPVYTVAPDPARVGA